MITFTRVRKVDSVVGDLVKATVRLGEVAKQHHDIAAAANQEYITASAEAERADRILSKLEELLK